MNSSASGSTFKGAEKPQAAAQAFVPAGGAQRFTPASTNAPSPQVTNFEALKTQLDTASKALKAFADALTQAMKSVSGDVAKPPQFTPTPTAQAPIQPQEQFKRGVSDDTDTPTLERAAEPLSPAGSRPRERPDFPARDYQVENRLRPEPSDPAQPQAVPDQPKGAPTQQRQRDERGRFLPQGGGGSLGAAMSMVRRHPIAAAALALGGFAFRQAGSTSINQALQGLPMGGMIAGSLGKLEEMGMRGAQFELAALQAGVTRGLGQGTGYATANSSYQSISSLSSALGIPPSAAANILRDVGSGTRGELSVADIAGLTVQGFDPSTVSALGGQLQTAGVGGAGTVLQMMGVARRQGLANAGVMSFAQAAAGFATGRRMMGLDITDASMTARRARSMILRDEDRPSLEANLATLGRFQSVGVSASKGLSGFMSGMSEQMLQAYAFEQAGGDIFKATALLEDMSADPVKMREAMRAQGASDEQIDLALLATGQLTTTDIRRGRQAVRGEEAPRMSTRIASTERSLAASRAVAEKGQRDLEQLYGAEGGQGESVVSRFNTLLQEQSKYQTQVLKKMPTSKQITAIVDKLIVLLEKTDFLAQIANNLYGVSGVKGAKVPPMRTGQQIGPNTRVRVRGGTRF